MPGDRIILDAVYDTRTAGELMGGLHPNDVHRLIDRGSIKARLRCVRGRRGRTVILGSEIKRFIESLPDKDPGPGTGNGRIQNDKVIRRRRRRVKPSVSDLPSW